MRSLALRRPRAAWLLVVALAAACTGGVPPTDPPTDAVVSPAAPSATSATGPIESPPASPEPSPEATAAASPTAEPLPTGLPPEVVAAIEWRREMGLRTDVEWVLAVAGDPNAVDQWAYPILPEEDRFIWARQQQLEPHARAAMAYGRAHPDVFGGVYLDNANSRIVTLWTADPEAHLAAILETTGEGAPIVAQRVRWSERELRDVQRRVSRDHDWFADYEAVGEGFGASVSENVVLIEISSANPDAPRLIAGRIARRLDVPVAMLRVESDGTGLQLMATGRVRGIVRLADGSAPGPDNGLMMGGRSDQPGSCFGEPFGNRVDADGHFDMACTVGTWTIVVQTYDSGLGRSVVWGEAGPVTVSEDDVPRVRIRLAPDAPIGE